jgi:hypothetical protein
MLIFAVTMNVKLYFIWTFQLAHYVFSNMTRAHIYLT